MLSYYAAQAKRELGIRTGWLLQNVINRTKRLFPKRKFLVPLHMAECVNQFFMLFRELLLFEPMYRLSVCVYGW